jgi:hypothetical protein
MSQYLPVNWVDGMKINKDHFIAERNAGLQNTAAAAGAFITDVNYGLLAPVAAEHNPFKIHVSLDNQEMIQVKLLSCRAITPGGYLVAVDEGNRFASENLSVAPVLQTPLAGYLTNPGVYAVLLSVNPFDPVAVGNAAAEELPPRLPFLAPRLSLSLVPLASLEGKKSGLAQLCVANVLIEKNKVVLADDYIPPCSSVAAHPELTDIFYGLLEFMSKMELYGMQILQKINQKKQSNDLALMVQRICEQLVYFQSTELSNLRWSGLYQPPYVMMGHITAQARLIKNVLDFFLNSGKEELLNYFTEWCDLNQGELETVITELSNYQYKHEDIGALVGKTLNYTRQLSSLFYKLSRLDYIGKKKDAGIFVKEEIVKTEMPDPAVKKPRRSFLADE